MIIMYILGVVTNVVFLIALMKFGKTYSMDVDVNPESYDTVAVLINNVKKRVSPRELDPDDMPILLFICMFSWIAFFFGILGIFLFVASDILKELVKD